MLSRTRLLSRHRLLLGAIAGFAILLTGCHTGLSSNAATGSVELTITGAGSAPARTLSPPMDMNVASFDVLGSGPDGASFRSAGISNAGGDGTVVSREGLRPGDWTIRAKARNAEGTEIAGGEVQVTLARGKTATTTLRVAPLPGNGTLNIRISWPTSLLSRPSISATITPSGGGASTPLDFSLSAGSSVSVATASKRDLSAGYYILTAQLRDGSTYAWGAAEVARIVAGQTTTGSFSLSARDFNATGTSSSTVDGNVASEIVAPLTVTLRGAADFLPTGTQMTVTSSVSPPAPDASYQWYLDGRPLSGATNSTITTGPNLSDGHYRLDLIVLSSFGAASNGTTFTVSKFAKTPVLLVPGYDLSATSLDPVATFLESQDYYPSPLVREVSLSPSDGANIPAAEQQIAPAVTQFLSDVNAYLAANAPDIPKKTRVDIVAHSMGALSSRWYTAKVAPDRVRKWVSLVGANHGTNDLCSFGTPGGNDSCPAFASSANGSTVQFDLNGGFATNTATDAARADRLPGNTIDETPYGVGTDSTGVTTIPPDSSRRILYYTIHISPDRWISPDSSATLDGAGGMTIPLPQDLPARRVSPGNFLMTDRTTHDGILSDTATLRLLALILNAG